MMNDIFTSLLIISCMMACLAVFKHFFGKTMPASWKYRLGYLFFVILLLPFIPCVSVKESSFESAVQIGEVGKKAVEAVSGSGAINSFAVNKTVYGPWLFIFALWAAGAVIVLAVFLISLSRLSKILKESKPASKRTAAIFEKCKNELDIDGKIILRAGKVKSPLVFGIFKTAVIIPEENMAEEDMRHIFMHELIHYKRGDIAINYAVCFFEILYWFNPMVWIAFKGLKADMEAACDEAVMEKTGDSYGYGMTIIRFAGKREFVSAAEMGGTKKQIVKRVKAAAQFKKATAKQRVISALTFAVLTVTVMASLPVVSVNAVEKNADMTGETVYEEDMSEYFDGFKGSFVLYDLSSDSYTIYNKEMSEKRVSPDSTYKIISALSALESGIISPDENTLKWDGEQNYFEAWNRDQNLSSAMQNSVNWYFDRLNENNRKNLENTFNTFEYGNCDLSGGNDFWMESSLKISPVEQIDVLKALYLNEYGFDEENVQAVKDSMKITDGFYGKTGSGMVNGKEVNGWFVGFVESEDNVWFFALNMNDENGANGSTAADAAIEILNDRGIIDYEI